MNIAFTAGMKYLSLILMTVFLSIQALAEQTPAFYNFACNVRRNNQTSQLYNLIDANNTELVVPLTSELVVNLKRIDNRQLFIVVTSDRNPETKPYILDGSKTQHLAMSNSGATIICFSHKAP